MSAWLSDVSRRTALSGGCACVAATAFGHVEGFTQNNPLPFCGFSLEDGWIGKGREYVSRRARENDSSGVPQIVDQILSDLGLSYDFDILILKDEDNAFATVANGKKILGIDVQFLDRLNRQVGTEWSAIQVIAHEVGHHIAGFDSNRHRGELRADYWSGQSLARLGSSKKSAQAAILAIGTERDTSSHPNKYARAEVIGRGWNDAKVGRLDRTFCTAC